jgi:hypothetical protein
MSGADLENKHRRGSGSTALRSPLSNGAADLPSISGTMMEGGYFFNSSHLHLSDDERHSVAEHHNRNSSGSSAHIKGAMDAVADSPSTNTRLPPIPAPTTDTGTRPSAASESNTGVAMASSTTTGAATNNKAAVTPLSSMPGATPMPPTSKVGSTRNTPMAATNGAGGVGKGPRPRRLSSDDSVSPVAQEQAVGSGGKNNNDTTSKSTTTAAAAASSPPKLPCALSTPSSVTHSAESTVHSTPQPGRPTFDSCDASLLTSDRVYSLPGRNLPKSSTPDCARVSTTTAGRRRYTTTAAEVHPPAAPPLSPQQENFVPMRRVSMTPRSSALEAAATTAASEGATPAAAATAAATSTSRRSAARNFFTLSATGPANENSISNSNSSSAVMGGTLPTSPFLSTVTNGHNISTPPPPSSLHTTAFGGPHTRPLAHPPPKPSPLPPHLPNRSRSTAHNKSSSGMCSPTARGRLASSRYGGAQSPEAAPTTTTTVDSDAPPQPNAVPQWLAELNDELLRRAPAAAAAAAAAPPKESALGASTSQLASSALAQHRTFSHAVTTSADDWLNPCSRPKGHASNAVFYASAQPAVTAAGLPPGVTASQYDRHMREDTARFTDDDGCRGAGSSETSLTDTNTNTSASRGTPNNKSMSNIDVAASSSNHTAPFTGGRWRAEDGATVRRQCPSRNSSLPGSIGSSDNAGFIPISREQRTMSPQSQRWESSGGLSLYSSVGDSAPAEHHTGPHQPNGVLLGLGRRRETSSVTSRGGGSDDIMAPVRLSRNDGGVAAAVMSTSTATMATGETLQPQEVKQEPLFMPATTRGSSLQPSRTSSGEDLAMNMKSIGMPQRYALSTESALRSASVLSTNEGPSAMSLPLARFMRNTSTGSSVAAHGRNNAPQQQIVPPMNNNNTAAGHHPLRTSSPPTHGQQQQQPALVYTAPSGRRSVPTVLSLSPENPEADAALMDDGNSGSGGQRAPTWGVQSSLRQGQVRTLDDNMNFTASLTMMPTDAVSTVSRATSGISLAAETTFVRCD